MIPTINKVSIIGLGNMGKSIAILLKEKGISKNIYGYDIDNEIMGKASREGIIKNLRFDSIEDIVRDSDVIILAMTLEGYAKTVNTIFPFIQENTAILELTTVKSFINNNVLPILRTRGKNLILCNPILSFVNEGHNKKSRKPLNIFQDKKVLITPYPNTRIDFINIANNIFQQFGAQVLITDSNTHDEMIANTLHFPYLLAFLYDVVLRESKTYINAEDDYDDSFLEFRKLIKSNIIHWKEIFYYNAPNIDPILEKFHDSINKVEKLIKIKKTKVLLELFEISFKNRILIEGTNKYKNKINIKEKQFLPNKKKKFGMIMSLPIIISHTLIAIMPKEYYKYLGDDFFSITQPIFNYKSMEFLITKFPEKVLRDIKKFASLINDFHALLNKKTLSQKDIKAYLRPSYMDE